LGIPELQVVGGYDLPKERQVGDEWDVSEFDDFLCGEYGITGVKDGIGFRVRAGNVDLHARRWSSTS
jgi:hypothetical protein